MSSIQLKKIAGHGPYAYRVEHIDGDKQKWEYLGSAGSVDPADLTNDEIEDLRDERVLSRYVDRTEADLHKLDTANNVRDQIIEEIGQDALSYQDDRRETVLKLSPEAPRDAEIIVENTAEDMAAATKAIGQEALTEEEKNRINRGDKSIFHARSSKAQIKEAGVSDWTAIYDNQIDDPSSFREIAKENRDSMGGRNLDNQEGVSRSSTSQRETESQQEEQALEYARQGDSEAIEFLQGRGWSREEIGGEA